MVLRKYSQCKLHRLRKSFTGKGEGGTPEYCHIRLGWRYILALNTLARNSVTVTGSQLQIATVGLTPQLSGGNPVTGVGLERPC